MIKLYIFDRNSGFLQHISDHLDRMEALKEFDQEVGIDPNGTGIKISDWHFVEADEAHGKSIVDWATKGHPSNESPLGC